MAIQPWLNQYLKEKQMSNTNLRQKWYSKKSVKIVYADNKELSQAVLELLKNHYKSNAYKKIAKHLDLNLYNVRNWFYKGTGFTAFELLKIMDNYYFVRLALGYYKVAKNDYLIGKKNRKEIRQKILEMLLENPKMTMYELAVKLDITPKSVEWHISELVKEGKIVRFGATKNGIWLVGPESDETEE